MLSSMPVQQYLARVKRDRVMLFRNDNDVIWIDPVQEEAFLNVPDQKLKNSD